jgi:hypothetical protein
MGSRYVRRALTHTYGERMPAAERLTLVAMAHHALDGKGKNPDHLPGTYWGGHKQLAREVYGADSANAVRKIRGHIANLESRRLIKVHDTTPGYNRAYLLFPEGEAL